MAHIQVYELSTSLFPQANLCRFLPKSGPIVSDGGDVQEILCKTAFVLSKQRLFLARLVQIFYRLLSAASRPASVPLVSDTPDTPAAIVGDK
jgi:hypothetical protein